MIDQIALLLQGVAVSFPQLTAIFAVLYVVGFGAKVIREAAKSIVAETPSKKDDEKLAALEQSKAAKAIFFVLDLFLRIKPVKKS
jgi:hypothetical protein